MKNIQVTKSEKLGLSGQIVARLATLSQPHHWALYRRILNHIREGKEFMHLVRQLNGMCKAKIVADHNLNPTVGRTMIMNNLTDATPDNTMLIDYTSLGTGTNAPANGDTQLQTEVFRKVTASRSNASNVGYVSAFYTTTETSGTYRECGLHSNATATANSGILVVRAAINITKTTSQTLTIDHTLTLA